MVSSKILISLEIIDNMFPEQNCFSKNCSSKFFKILYFDFLIAHNLLIGKIFWACISFPWIFGLGRKDQ